MKQKMIVGLFVLSGLILFGAGLFLIGNQHQAFNKHVEFYTQFANLGGLAKGAKVRVSGMEAGQVTGIDVPDSPAARFRVKFQIDESLHGLVRTDSFATIETQGVVGDIFLLVHPGSAQASRAARLSTVRGKEPFELSDMIEKGNGLISDADTTIKTANTTIQQLGGKLNGTVGQVDTTIANVNDIVVGIKKGRGAVGMLLQDPQFAGQVQQTVGNANKATADLAHASGQADQMISDLQSRNLPQKVDDTMNSAKSAAAQLDATSKQLNQTIAEATGPDSQGVSTGANIRESLSNTNAATANLADDTEALKHEFFFKGFFKKRGYYDLSHLSPDQYRANPHFTSPADTRTWLAATDLFELRPDGTEQLSQHGKSLLDDTVAHDGVSAVERPIVVEGYRGGTDPADQLARSRSRAILVSQYLEKHFQLDPGNVGFVSLGSSPPAGLGHGTWDGVCVVLLKIKK